ncbi:nudix hydrolase 8-like isoform X2 [Lycium barbarum]|uniref:nudix hydrolase 8-like isoform X2 n=1 Tax=Lycium barbarum TaxID=112863 RepID=UPI00293E25C6|nr:nudix hydrolase 8-like isoform X2 [Lycium barbarum]
MELKFVDYKAISMCKSVDMKGMEFSSSFVDSKLMSGVNVAPKFCSCRGLLMKNSYSSASYDATRSVSEKNFLVDTFSDQINGTNHTSLYFRDKWVLDAADDEYGGVLINPERLPSNPDKFSFVLRASLSHWKVKEGFQYHHAERGYVMMTYWIPDEPYMLPSNASHQVGVGGFVINDKNEVLVVQEKHSAPALSGLWKIPTGFILESEEIFTGVVREVKEETGINTEFVEVMAFRHAHSVAFEKSDLFFVCLLRPLSKQIMVDDLEIQSAKWMPLIEFVEQPLIQGDDMFKKIIDIFIARIGKRYCGLSVHQLVSKFDDKLSTLYFNTVDDPGFNCQAS